MLRLWLLVGLIIAVGASGLMAATRREDVLYARYGSYDGGIGGYIATGVHSIMSIPDRFNTIIAAVKQATDSRDD